MAAVNQLPTTLAIPLLPLHARLPASATATIPNVVIRNTAQELRLLFRDMHDKRVIRSAQDDSDFL